MVLLHFHCTLCDGSGKLAAHTRSELNSLAWYKLKLRATRSDSQLTALKTERLLIWYVFSLVSFAPWTTRIFLYFRTVFRLVFFIQPAFNFTKTQRENNNREILATMQFKYSFAIRVTAYVHGWHCYSRAFCEPFKHKFSAYLMISRHRGGN